MIHALYIDDEPSLLEIAKIFIEEKGDITLDITDSSSGALSLLQSRPYDIVICDYQMPELDGISLLKNLRSKRIEVPFILFTGKGREDIAMEALNNGADFYFQKGGHPNTIFGELHNAIIQLHHRAVAERDSEVRRKELDLLYDAYDRMGSTLDLQTIYRTMMEFVSKTMDCSGVFVSAYSKEDQMIRCSFAWIEGKQLDAGQFPAIPLEPEGMGTQSMVIRTGKTMLVNDYLERLKNTQTSYNIEKDGSVSGDLSDEEDQTKSAVLVPLKYEGEVIGVVQVFSWMRDSYTPGQVRLVEALCGHASAAISIATYYQQMRSQIDERIKAESQMELLTEAFARLGESVIFLSGTDGSGKFHVLAAHGLPLDGLEKNAILDRTELSQALELPTERMEKALLTGSTYRSKPMGTGGFSDCHRQGFDTIVIPLQSEEDRKILVWRRHTGN